MFQKLADRCCKYSFNDDYIIRTVTYLIALAVINSELVASVDQRDMKTNSDCTHTHTPGSKDNKQMPLSQHAALTGACCYRGDRIY